MTIRDTDCADFDVERCIVQFKAWKVTLFSFFAGGYVTTYPTRLAWQKVSAHLAPGRDLCGEILGAAHREGMVAFPMIDLGELPLDLARQHPEWAAQKADGSFYIKTDGIAVSCPLGHYRRGLARELVAELKNRYGDELDGIKWGGASYGFPPGVDHNPLAAAAYRNDTGRELPASAQDPDYAAWRSRMMTETVAHLRQVVHEIARVPVVGNSVWHLGEGLALEELTPGQDFTQVEIQTRTHSTPDDADVSWLRFSCGIETTRYVAACCRNPPWVVASYFLAWPWRRVACPWPEQKLYLAQVAANGGTPMVNLTTGSPAHHQDPRGFRAVEELYGFMARHDAWYQGDASAAQVGVVYDHPSALAAGRAGPGQLYRRYLDEFQACEDALDRWHIPYEVLSTRMLEQGRGGHLRALVIPGPQGLAPEALQRLLELRRGGTALLATGPLPEGEGRDAGMLEAVFGIASCGPRRPFRQGSQTGPLQAYLAAAPEGHPLLEGIPVPLIAAAGHWQPVVCSPGTCVPLRRAEPFRLFPEGISYPDRPDPGEPMAACREYGEDGGARSVVFAFELGRTMRKTGHPDAESLLVNALAWATLGRVSPICTGFPDVRLSLRRARPGWALHAVNTTGRGRYLTEFTPVHGLELAIPVPESPVRVLQASSGAVLPFQFEKGAVRCTLPHLVDYDLVLLEKH